MRTSGLLLVFGVLLPAWTPQPAVAAADAAQRRELADIRRDVLGVTALIRQKKFDEAEQALKAAEDRLTAVKTAAGLDDNDPLIRNVSAALAQKRAQLPVSFIKDVAPLLSKNCTGCHAAGDPKGNLRLDTFGGLKQGGKSGPLVVPGNPRRSLLYLRLIAPGNARMPKDGEPLDPKDIQTIGSWIAGGARFDGTDEDADLGSLGGDGAKMKKDEPVTIPKPTGNETVSFTKDIAPFMVNLCLGCHSGNNPRGGLSLVTFESLMRGGDSGEVIIPGNMEDSRLFRLVGGLENPRMPQGQARITRQNYEDLKTWFKEGNTFDGKDPKTPLRELVPTPAEMRAAELAKLSPAEWAALRKERADETWDRVFPGEKPQTVETDEFLVYGNVPETRLKQVGEWAEAHADSLRSMFGVKDVPLWKGKLAVFVIKERYGYDEFNLIVERREAPPEMIGHSVVSPSMEDAYAVVLDVGDTVSADSPGLKISLIDQMTGAFLQRGGGNLPDWAIRGTGLALAAKDDSRSEYVLGLRQRAGDALRSVRRPEDIFANGTFSPSQVGPVGYTLVEFLLTAGGPAKFGQFIQAVQQGASVAEAAQRVYRADLKALGTAYAASVGGGAR